MTMVITAILLHIVTTERWKWPRRSPSPSRYFLLIELGLLGANLLKLMRGGWLPLGIAACVSR